MRARLRVVAAVVLALLATASAILATREPAVQPLLAARPDCAPRFDAEMAALRPLLPARGVLAYVGPRDVDGCHPMYVAQYALAPVWIAEMGAPDDRALWRRRGAHALPMDPALVIAYGDEGRAWLAASPRHRVLAAPSRELVLAGRDP